MGQRSLSITWNPQYCTISLTKRTFKYELELYCCSCTNPTFWTGNGIKINKCSPILLFREIGFNIQVCVIIYILTHRHALDPNFVQTLNDYSRPQVSRSITGIKLGNLKLIITCDKTSPKYGFRAFEFKGSEGLGLTKFKY